MALKSVSRKAVEVRGCLVRKARVPDDPATLTRWLMI
jgi:hypothetical protein